MQRTIVEKILTKSGIIATKKDYDITYNVLHIDDIKKDLGGKEFSIISLENNPVLLIDGEKYKFSAIAVKEKNSWRGVGLHVDIEGKYCGYGLYPSNKHYSKNKETYKMLKRVFDKI